MFLRKGGYRFPANAVAVTMRSNLVRDGAGRPYAQVLALDAQGQLYATGQAAVTAACAQLEIVLARPYEDVVFHRDDGGIAYALFNATSTTGVVCEGPTYPVGGGGFDYVSGRNFAFTASAEYPLPASNLILLTEFQETVSSEGGGPIFAFLQPVSGKPLKQRVYDSVPYTATQSGTAVGLRGYPIPPPPLWPAALMKAPKITRGSAKRVGNDRREFPISWEYVFGSDAPLAGVPNQWVR